MTLSTSLNRSIGGEVEAERAKENCFALMKASWTSLNPSVQIVLCSGLGRRRSRYHAALRIARTEFALSA